MNITTYIRKEDEDKWNAIPNKSLWLHHALNGTAQLAELPTVLTDEKPDNMDDPFEQFLKDYSLPGTKPPHPEYGYPCCHKDSPCKHWQWDGVIGAYVNQLTKKEREA